MADMICADCAVWHTNGDDSGAGPEFAPSGDWVVTADGPVDFHRPFFGCPSCGTALAGTYWEAVPREDLATAAH